MLCAVALGQGDDGPQHLRLGRELNAGEREVVAKNAAVFAETVNVIAAELRRAGKSCRASSTLWSATESLVCDSKTLTEELDRVEVLLLAPEGARGSPASSSPVPIQSSRPGLTVQGPPDPDVYGALWATVADVTNTGAPRVELKMPNSPSWRRAAMNLDSNAISRVLRKLSTLPPRRPLTATPGATALSAEVRARREREVTSWLFSTFPVWNTFVVDRAPLRPSFTISPEDLRGLRASAPDVDPALFEAFAKSLSSGALPQLPPGLSFSWSGQVSAIFRDAGTITDGWIEFSRRFPKAGGFLKISAIAFSSDGTQAMVAVDRTAGALAGGGNTYVLARSADGRWSLLYSALNWIS